MPVIPAAEYLPPAELRAAQETRWRTQRDYVAAHSGFYKRLWGNRRLPESLDGLGDLPFSDKAMLRVSQQEHPPFGDYIAAPPEKIVRLHRTSGTTGQAMNIALSAADAEITARIGGRAQAASGLGPGHRVIHCLNYQMWMGGVTDHLTLEATGATVVPFGVGDTELLVRTIRELRITAISCTPSYPAVIERVIDESYPGLEPRDLGLQLGLFGGEAGLDNAELRARFVEVWGFRPCNSNYGVSDVLSNFAGQCTENTDLHFVGGDVLYPELIDPETGASLPWREGEQGELVLTHLEKECQPLAHFRTGDIIALTGLDRCACGRTTPRLRVVGRSDDMVVVRGLNVFPTQLAAVLNGFPRLSGEYRIVLKGNGPYDRLPVQAEMAPDEQPDGALAGDITAAIKKYLGVTAEVTLLPPRSFPVTSGKTKRVIRE